MFERFTPAARQVVVLAQEEARALQHNYIGTEHILLGLLREDGVIGARALNDLGVTLPHAREHVTRIVGSGEETMRGQIPFTPRAKRMLELAGREADSLGHGEIGPEHILLGLARENEGVAIGILLDFDADADKVRNEVIRMLGGPGPQHRDPRVKPPPRPARPATTLSYEVTVVAGEKQGAIEAHDRERFALLHEREGRLHALEIELRGLHDRTRAAGREKEEAIEAENHYRAAAARDRERKLRRLDNDAQELVAQLTAVRTGRNAAVDAAIAELEKLVGDARRGRRG